MSGFDEAFRVVIGHEGGYVNDPRDPGLETKFGISKRAYPDEDIAHMTLDRARHLYRRDYWVPLRCDELPYPLALQLFDAGINHGVRRAVILCQRALGVADDGVFGPKTLAAALAVDPVKFALRFNAARLRFYTELPTFAAFGRGWVRRVASNMEASA